MQGRMIVNRFRHSAILLAVLGMMAGCGVFKDPPPPMVSVQDGGLVAACKTCTIKQIQDHQDPAYPPPSSEVTLEGVVITSPISQPYSRSTLQGFFLEAPSAGPQSGIYIQFPTTMTASITSKVAVGNVVNITGIYEEYFGNTQLTLTDPEKLTKIGTAAVPGPDTVTCEEVMTAARLAEDYEGVLICVENAVVTQATDRFGQFRVCNGLAVGPLFFPYAQTPKPSLGTRYQKLCGPLHYSYNESKLEPRNSSDMIEQ